MAINWPSMATKNYLSHALAANNMRVIFVDNVPTNKSSFTDAQVQAFIDAFDYVPPAKERKIAELKAEGLVRVQQVFPSISDFDELNLVRNQMLSVAPTARSFTADIQNLIDIYTAGTSAQAAINALTVLADVENYDVVNTPTWPVI